MSDRNLTDADVQAIVDKLKTELVEDFYGDLGRGVWAFIKKALIGLLLVLAVYGMASGKTPFHHIPQVGQ